MRCIALCGGARGAAAIGGSYDKSCGTITVDTGNLTDETSEDGLTRTIMRKPGVDASNAFDAWAEAQRAGGATLRFKVKPGDGTSASAFLRIRR